MSAFNLPAGVTLAEINGPTMPRCAKCRMEFNPVRDEELCDECARLERIDDAIMRMRNGIAECNERLYEKAQADLKNETH